MSAADASPRAESGAVNGTIVDEENAPIGGVDVAIVESNVATKTDGRGSFTLNDVLPGAYSLVANRIGYAPGGVKIQVVAGEVTTVRLLLKPLAFDEEPYQLTIPRSAYINVGLYALNTAARLVNHSALNGLTCEPCDLIVHFPKGAQAILLESHWTRANEAPMVNQGIDVNWDQPEGDGWSNIGTTVMASRDSHLLNEGDTAIMTKHDRMLIAVQAAVYEGVMLQQRLDFYTSLAYVEAFPDGFTALPPE